MSEGTAPFPAERWVDALVLRAWWLSPLLVALVSASLAEIGIERSITLDEAEALRTATGSWHEIWEEGRSVDPTSLATWALWKPWLALAGTSEAAARTPALVFGALACAVLVLVGGRLLDRVAGTLAGVLLATNSFFVVSSQTVSGLTLGLFLAVSATWAILRAVEDDGRRWWAGYVVCMTLAVVVSLAMAPVVVAHVVYVALRTPRGRWVRPATAFGVLAALVSAFAVAVLTSDAGRIDWIDPPSLGAVARAVWEVLGENPAVAVAASAGVVLLARQAPGAGSRPRLALLGSWLGAPLVLALLASIAWAPLDAVSLVAMAPAAALLAAAAVAMQRLTVAIAAGVVLAVAAGVTLAAEIRDSPSADWRAAVHHLEESREIGESVVVRPVSAASALEHSLPGVGTSPEAAGKGVWLFLYDTGPDEGLATGRAVVGAPAYALLERRHFGSALEVQHWVRP